MRKVFARSSFVMCASLVTLFSWSASAQSAGDALDAAEALASLLAEESYGSEAEEATEYYAEELFTRSGKVISYRLADEYDGFTAKLGSNATFVDMNSGVTRTVVEEGGDELLLNIDMIYDDSPDQYAVGYVARVGTQDDYARGRINLIVGRLSDLSQVRVSQGISFVDAPTFVLDNSISMIVWPGPEEAQFMIVNLDALEVSQLTKIDLPQPVELEERKCECGS